MVWYNPATWGEDISNAINIPQGIQVVFDKISSFLDATILFFTNTWVVFLVLFFFALVILLFLVPIKVYPIYQQNKKMIDRLRIIIFFILYSPLNSLI